MPQVLPIEDLRDALRAIYSRAVPAQSKILRKYNIDAFFAINREGLRHSELEHRIQLYSTAFGEKIYIQLPGKESVLANSMPYDFRPKLRSHEGVILPDISFGNIWDALDVISRNHNEHLAIVATMFFRIGHMYDYIQANNNYECVTLQIDGDSVIEIENTVIPLSWYCLNLPDDVWFSLRNYIGDVQITDNYSVSFEAFVKFVDLLVQNEDCKYYYRNAIVNGNDRYRLNNGRTSTCDANLLVIEYLKGESHISSLLDSFQKSRGVPPFKKGCYPTVTDNIVSIV